MNVDIKHNGTSIRGFTQAYEREHKICTGIGTLRVEVVNTINRTFNPWNTIDIHENGDFKCRYYISSVEDIVPKGILVLECQDISKRLVDYFIPDSYTIDYPSYTRYWIDKFLTEAGIDVTFTTSSPGNIISNNTQLGLKPAYEQILTLLQMSGWFIYFNESEEAVVGPLDADLSANTKSVGKTEILNINVISDDKMLRNRALVLGTFDPFTLTYASADVNVHTRWNYDHNDVRAVVISNSNIPNRGTAYAMANQIIKEFARITVEKHISVANAKNWNLGDALRVTSNIWRGKGLITTFGTSMSKQGLVTNVILDERCPRLFGFFDFGDYVYVGTFGDGVWKKHIKFDPTFYDFSSGLTNLNVTDLHINNGVFGSVTHSGEMYYSPSEDGPWSPFTVVSLDSSLEPTASGNITYTPFSGLKARATIVDKFGNTVKYGVDTLPRTNNGDYFMDFYTSSGTLNTTVFSGIMDKRGWIIEVDPFTGSLVGGIGSGIYPVHFSGSYELGIIDLENDGTNDFVSVVSHREGTVGEGFDYGHKTTNPLYHDQSNLVGSSPNYTGNSIADATTKGRYIATFSDETDGVSEYLYRATNSIIRTKITKTFNVGNQNFDLASSTVASTAFLSGATVCGISKYSTDSYRITYYRIITSTASTHSRTFYFRTWDATANSLSGESTIGTASLSSTDFSGTFAGVVGESMEGVINGYFYFYYIFISSSSFIQRPPVVITDPLTIDNIVGVSQVKVSLETSSITQQTPIRYDFGTGTLMPGTGNDTGAYISYFFGTSTPFAGMMQDDYLPHFVFPIAVRSWDASTDVANYFLVLKDTVPSTVLGQAESDPNFVSSSSLGNKSIMQLTDTDYIIFVGNPDTATDYFYYNGLIATSGNGIVLGGDFFPSFGLGTGRFIANKSGQYMWVSASNFSEMELIDVIGYTSLKFFSNSGDDGTLFWTGVRAGATRLVNTNFGGTVNFEKNVPSPFTLSDWGIIAGNLYISVERVGDASHILEIPGVAYIDGLYPAVISFNVLRRDGADFDLIQTSSRPIRIDISNNAPVLTVLDSEDTFQSHFVYGTSLTSIIPTELEDVRVDDYRYTYLENHYSGGTGITSSGMPVMTMGLYVSASGITASGVMGGDIATYSGGFNLMFNSPSGLLTRIETSNYGLGGQYVFVTTSGDNPMFYQKDPEVFDFTAYAGLPDSRATIIRLDDRI